MPANQKVSVAWQIVATFIIIANFWAFYRIRKLRKYLLYVGAPSFLFAGVLFYLSFVGVWVNFSSGGYDFASLNVFIITQLIGWGLQGFAVYLVIKWSREHNRQFDTQSNTT